MSKRWLLAFLLIAIVHGAHSAHAVGIAPAKISFSMSPGEAREVTYYAINDLGTDVVVEPYVSGPLSSFAVIRERQVYLKPNEIKPFTVTLTMPNTLEPRYESYVGVVSASATQNSGLSARVAAESFLEVSSILNKPALKLGLDASGTAPVLLQLTLYNPTTVPVENTNGMLEVFDAGRNKSYAFKISKSLIAPAETKEQKFEWSPPANGEFIATANIKFDDGSASQSIKFQVGEKLIEIKNVRINKNGGVIEIAADVENKWNTEISAWAEISVLEKGAALGTAKSQTENVLANGLATLTAYFETEKNPNDLDFDITIHFDKLTAQKKVSGQQQTAAGGGEAAKQAAASALSKLSGAFSALNGIKINKTGALITSVLIAALLIGLFAYSRRQLPPKQNPDAYQEYYKKYYERLKQLEQLRNPEKK